MFWLGRGASDLGLDGAVVPEQFLALSAGKAPDGGRLLERVAADRTPGWDITLSAPKSISLAWALADEPLRERLAEAHRDAVAATFSFLEQEGGRARRGLGGRDGHVRAGLAIACFTHPASRELDPQLHTHGIVLNVAHGEDERWTALDSRTIYLHRRAGRHLPGRASRAVAALGGNWAELDRRGLSELRGLRQRDAAGVLQAPERYRGDAREAGRERPGGERGGLSRHPQDQGRRRARGAAGRVERAGEQARLGRGTRRLCPRRRRTGACAPDEAGERVAEQRLIGPRGLTRDKAAFTRDDALVAWAESHRQGAKLSTLERLTEATLCREEIVPLVVADEDGQPLTTRSGPVRSGVVRLMRSPAAGTEMLVCERRYSTTELLATESHVLATALCGRRGGRAVVRQEGLEEVLASRPYLGEEQTRDGAGRSVPRAMR